MTFGETKRLLENIKQSKRLCVRIRQEITDIREDYSALTSCLGNPSGVRVSDGAPAAERLILRLDVKQERFEKELDKFMDLEDRLAVAVQKLDTVEQDVIIDSEFCLAYNIQL